MATNNYFESFRENAETIDDVLAFLNGYMANLSPNREIKVKIGNSIATDLIGNIYLTAECICDFLDKSHTVKDASLKLLGHVLHEFMHWVFTDKTAWDNGVNRYESPREKQLMQYLINSIEDGRGESAFMNKYYGAIYPMLYSNNAISKSRENIELSGLEAVLYNIITLSVSYTIKDFDLEKKYQNLQDEIIRLMQDKDIWSLSSTQLAADVADEIFALILNTLDDEDEKDNQQGNQSSDGEGNGEQNQDPSSEQDSQQNEKQGNSSNKSNSGQSSPSELDQIDFDKLKEAFKNYKDKDSPGRDKGYEEHVNHDDYIDFSNIVNELSEIVEDDVKIPELEALAKKYDNEQKYSYTESTSNSSDVKEKVDNQLVNIPDLSNLPDENSKHSHIKMKNIIPTVSTFAYEVYEKNKLSLETDIEELLLLLRNILKKKVENQTEEVVYSGSLDQDKLLNIALNKLDIFEVINDISNNIDNSIFIAVDLSGSMIPRQKHMTKSLIILHEVLKSLGVKHAIWGFNTFGKEVHHHPFITFDNCFDDNASYNLGDLKTYGENRDGYSIRFFQHYIRERGQNPLYITMTDGNPNHTRYRGKSAIADTKNALENMDLPTVAFCIGDKENMNIQSIYDNAIECQNVHELPELLHEFLLDIMH